MSSHVQRSADRHSNGPERHPRGTTRKVWRLQYGPCWCQGLPGDSGSSFDLVRTSTCESHPGVLDRHVLIVPDRVIDGSRQVFLQLLERVPEPHVVITTAACPATSSFWEQLPLSWSPTSDIMEIDLHVPECVTGHPEALLAAVLDYAGALQSASPLPSNTASFSTAGETARGAFAIDASTREPQT